jgi:hypothetical protein
MKTLRRDLIWILPIGLGVGLILSLLDVVRTSSSSWWIGWLAYGLVLTLGLTALSALWRSAGGRMPPTSAAPAGASTARPAAVTLAWILILTVALRLILGVVLTFILPVAGNGSEAELAGYVLKDAYHRDTQAWQLASSGESLLRAFDKNYSTDQYGGLLALSAIVYRSISPDAHRPWLILLIGAFAYAAGLALAWKAIYKAWGDPKGKDGLATRLAVVAGWVLAFYPESVLQGASQMREPFLVAFICMLFWGFVALGDGRRSAWLWLAGGLAGLLLFSPAVAIIALVILGTWAWLRSGKRRISWKTAGVTLGVLLTVVLVGLTLLWKALARGYLAGTPPWITFRLWLLEAYSTDVYHIVQQSGWLQQILAAMPEPLHIPFITLTGLIQPILPGTIVDATAWPWHVINVLRSAGWYALVPFLFFGLIAVWKRPAGSERRAWLWMWLFVAGWIVFSSLRAAGDQWDNPRYRVILLLPEALLAALAWAYWRESRNPWLRRILAIEGVFVLLFTYWYVVRAIGWTAGQVHVFVIVGAILALSGLIILGGWIWDWRKARRRD